MALMRHWDGAPVLDLLPRKLTREGVIFGQHIREGRFQNSLSFIAGVSSVLSGVEVTYEHYRGSYGQRIMYTPVALSPALMLAGIWASMSRRAARTVLPAVSAITFIDGVTGFVFHVRGVARKPGGWRIPLFNRVMGPPVFAPLLFAIPAYIGLVATLLRREDDPADSTLPRFLRPKPIWHTWWPERIGRRGLRFEHEVREGRFQQHLAGATGIWALFSGAEAYYSHYKNGYKYTMQWTPVVIASLLVAGGFGAVKSPDIAKTLLPAASILAIADGSLGFYYHARGVLRRPGGRKLLFYNLMYGAPVFAPLLLGACGFLGLLASVLRRSR